MDNRTRIFIVLFVIYAYFTHSYITTNDAPRFSLTAAIVDKHTFEIGSLPERIIYPGFNPIDFAVYEGKIYSDKAPLGSFLAIPFYMIAKLFTSNYSVLYYICSLFVSGLLTALTCVLLYDIGRYFTKSESLRILISLGYGLGTMAFYYGTTFFSHSITTFFGFAAFYLLFRIKKGLSETYLVLAGIFTAFTVMSDYSAGIILVFLSLYCIISFKRKSIRFLIPLVFTISTLFLYHYAIFENPFTTPYKNLGSSRFADQMSQGIYGIGLPQMETIIPLTFSPYRGLFFYSPILILCLVYLPRLYRRYKLETALIVLIAVSYFLFNISYLAGWWGGSSWGPRFLMPMIPFLFLSLYEIKGNFRFFYFLLGLSVIVNFITVNLPLPSEYLKKPLVEYGIPYLKQYGSINFLSFLLLYKVQGGFVDITEMPLPSFLLLIPLAFIVISIGSERFRGFFGIFHNPKYFLILLLLAYIPITYFGLKDVDYGSDEYIYFQIAKAITDGFFPYKEVYATHMPLMLFVPALFFRLFGSTTVVGNFVSIFSSFLVLFLTYLIGEKFKSGAGALACLLIVLTSPLFHLYNHHYYGIFLALVPVLASYYFYLNRKYTVSGFLIALSLFVRLNNLFFFILLLFLNRKDSRFYRGLLLASPLLLFFFVPNFFKSAILFQLLGYHAILRTKTNAIRIFISNHILMLILFLLGFLYLKRKQNLRVLFVEWSKGQHQWLTLAIYPITYLLLMFSTARWVYLHYFIFIIPFLSILGSVGLLSLLERKKDIITTGCVLLLVFGLPFSVHIIPSVYEKSQSPNLDKLIRFIKDNSEPDDEILYFYSGYGQSISWKSERGVVDNLFFFTVPYERFDEKFLSALKKNPPFVIVDLTTKKVYDDLGLKLEKAMNYLKENYRPVFFVDGPTSSVVVIWEHIDRLSRSEELEGPDISGRMYYFGKLFTVMEDGNYKEEAVFNETLTTEIFIPDNLKGNNTFNISLISDNLLRWPLKSGDTYSLKEGNLTSEVWFGPVHDEIIELFVFTSLENVSISFSHINLNYLTSVPEEIVIYSGLMDISSNFFYPTYQQFPITPDKYSRFDELIQRQREGEISWEEYKELSRELMLSYIDNATFPTVN